MQANPRMVAERRYWRRACISDHVYLDALLGQRERVILHARTAAQVTQYYHYCATMAFWSQS